MNLKSIRLKKNQPFIQQIGHYGHFETALFGMGNSVSGNDQNKSKDNEYPDDDLAYVPCESENEQNQSNDNELPDSDKETHNSPGRPQLEPISAPASPGELSEVQVPPPRYTKGRKNTRRKSVITDVQRKNLFEIFEKDPKPSKEIMSSIATKLGLEFPTVKNWFTRTRSFRNTNNRAAASNATASVAVQIISEVYPENNIDQINIKTSNIKEELD